MIYTLEEKTKMDVLLGVFQAYVDSREDYDVVYSRKAGYLRVITAENCDRIYFPIAGFRDLVRMFTDDFLTDEEERAGHYLKRDYELVRNMLLPKLDALGAYRAEAYTIMEETVEACRLRGEDLRRSQQEEIRRLEELLASLRACVE